MAQAPVNMKVTLKTRGVEALREAIEHVQSLQSVAALGGPNTVSQQLEKLRQALGVVIEELTVQATTPQQDQAALLVAACQGDLALAASLLADAGLDWHTRPGQINPAACHEANVLHCVAKGIHIRRDFNGPQGCIPNFEDL